MLKFSLLSIPLLYLSWAITSPVKALGRIQSWKRRLNAYVERRAFEQSTRQLAKKFREAAKREGYDPDIIDEVLSEQLPKIAGRLVSKWKGEYLS